ncbi:MAG: hypothetical protein ACR2O3_09840 [Rhizobiaceae bacterium]
MFQSSEIYQDFQILDQFTLERYPGREKLEPTFDGCKLIRPMM